jgi:hypothetical protein
MTMTQVECLDEVDVLFCHIRFELECLAVTRASYGFTAAEQARYDALCREERDLLSLV